MNLHEPIPESFSASSVITPRRIALLGYRSDPHVGGQGIYLKYLSRALAKLGHTVDVLSGPPYPELDDNIRLIKIPSLDLYASADPMRELRWKHFLSVSDLYEYGSKMTGGFGEPYVFSRRAAKYLLKHRSNYDIVHDNQCLGHGLITLQKAGIPVIATIHHPITRDRNLAVDAQDHWFMKLATKRWYRFLSMQIKVSQKLHHVATVSKQSQHDIFNEFNRPQENTHIVANGIDIDTFKKLSEEKIPGRIISTASSDQPLKGQKYLLLALAAIIKKIPAAHLVLIGEFKPGSECAQIIDQHQLKKYITFRSNISTQELVKLYNSSCVAVTPSLYEGFGLPAAEAMACATAVITTDAGALPEIVGNAGKIVAAGDEHQLSLAIEELLTNTAKRHYLEVAGRKRIEQHFSWHNCALEFSKLYETMLEHYSEKSCTPSNIHI
ncbi:glycosyltransferase family 4 protein [Sessilibacter corallicola]|uniref:Glycosyltransferase family 4 protein n=1 Tax=Sessilibacter corallicola TaxID=2904075 RepID=A0ABQ0A5U3_9GAMM